MKKLSCVLFTIVFSIALSGCSKDPAGEGAAGAVQPGQPATPENSTASNSAAEPRPTAEPVDKATIPVASSAPATFEIPPGTEVNVLLIDSISTGKNKAGDSFTASLAEPLIVNGETVMAKGTKVQGRVVDAEGAGRIKGKANIRLILTSIIGGGQTYPIVTKPLVAEAESTTGRDAGIIGGAAGIGAAIGALAGGKKGAGDGALIGGAAGTGAVLATKGKEVEFGSETKLKFTLEKAAHLPKLRT